MCQGIDIRFALDLEIFEWLLDDRKRILAVLQTESRVTGADRQRIPEIQQRIEPVGSSVAPCHDVAVTGKVLVLDSNDATVFSDRS